MRQTIPFHQPWITEETMHGVHEVLRSGWLTSGPKVAEFEKAFAKYVRQDHAVAMNSCTAALHVALATHAQQGGEVLVPAITWPSTANVALYMGMTPVFVDVLEDDLTMDPDDAERKITPRTKAILPVHFAGMPCQIDKLRILAKNNGLFLIADAAHAIETGIYGANVSHFADVSCYSFYATKNITTGEGGMLTTNDPEVARVARILRIHGVDKDAWNRHGDEGYKHWDQTMLAKSGSLATWSS